MRTIEPGRPSIHILAFVLLGLLLGLATASGQKIFGFGMGLLLPDFCLTIELLQAATTTRHPRLGDLLLNLLVAWFVHALASRGFAGSRPLQRLAAGARGLSKLALGLLMVLFVTSPFFRSIGASLDNWDPDQVLVVGDEIGGGRPWSGTIQQLALYPRVLSDPDRRSLHDNGDLDLRRKLGASLLFDFRSEDLNEALRQRIDGQHIHQLVGKDLRVDLDGVHLAGGSRMQSPGPPIDFVRAARGSDAFVIEVRLSPGSLHQTGPARILGISKGLFQRNFTLGQVGADLILRVRTPWNGDDGSEFEARWSRALIPEGLHHFVIGYDRGRYRLERDGQALLPDQDQGGPGIGVAMLDLYQPLASFLLVLLPLGMILAWLLKGHLAESRRRGEALLGLVLTAFYLMAGYWTQASPEVLTLLILLLGIPFGDLLGTWLVHQDNKPARVVPPQNPDEVP